MFVSNEKAHPRIRPHGLVDSHHLRGQKNDRHVRTCDTGYEKVASTDGRQNPTYIHHHEAVLTKDENIPLFAFPYLV